MTSAHWMRASQLPYVLAFFERSLHSQSLIAKIGHYIHPEFVLWATSANGVQSTKKCYETLETYGDTILKLAATHLAYDQLEADPAADEKKINDMKNSFVTNLFLFRIGKKLNLNEFMRTKDPEPKQWYPPFTDKAAVQYEQVSCTGKNIADCVESLLGAFFLSNNVYKTLRFISDINLVPMKQARLLEVYPDEDLTFQLGVDLDAYGFTMEDDVSTIFDRYFKRHQSPEEPYQIGNEERDKILKILKLDEKPALFASKYDKFASQNNVREMDTEILKIHLKDLVCTPVEQILGYKFNDKNQLLAALTHRSFKDAHRLTLCYEKLEVLGDAILDYIANSNLIKFTMFERYNIPERKAEPYISPEDFKPFDAHQAKSLLTKNDFLAKLITLFGIQEYILYEKKKPGNDNFHNQEESKEDGRKEWHKSKQAQQLSKEYDLDRYILYSFKKNFLLNNRDVELFEPSKILGDVFEALIGAVFIDGGIKQVLKVYQHLLAPFILFVAKHSKRLNKEPKEDFTILSGWAKIAPQLNPRGEHEITYEQLEKLKAPLTFLSQDGQVITQKDGKTVS